MIALLVTVLLFVTVGAGAAGLLRLTIPGTIPGRVAFWYLSGISTMGTVLYVLGVVGVPLTRLTVLAVFVVAIVIVARNLSRLCGEPFVRHHAIANVILGVPVIALILMASVLPIRDYDGRVTWLPKALAIAHDATIDGPFFQGEAGLNLHNEYPLLMPLNAAAVLIATGRLDVEAARWLYALVAIAAFLAARDLIALSQPRFAGWVVASSAWLPALVSVEGGALAAYNDVTMLALTGVSVVALHTAKLGDAGVRTTALFLPGLVFLKNEGAIVALALLLSAAVVRRLRSLRDWITVLVPVVAAVVVLLAWRQNVPAAYDERYDVLIRTLPKMLHRLPDALKAFAIHSVDRATWGWFWPVTLAATLISLKGNRRVNAVGPIVVLFFMICVYSVTFAITSWNIAELARVAASRLLLHLVIPACFVVTVAVESMYDWRVRPIDGPPRD